jgi:hypothetical protein
VIVIVATDSVVRYNTSILNKELRVSIELEAMKPVWAHCKEKSPAP